VDTTLYSRPQVLTFLKVDISQLSLPFLELMFQVELSMKAQMVLDRKLYIDTYWVIHLKNYPVF